MAETCGPVPPSTVFLHAVPGMARVGGIVNPHDCTTSKPLIGMFDALSFCVRKVQRSLGASQA